MSPSLHDLYFGKRDLRVILSGQRSFGTEVFRLLREADGVELVAVYAPPGDKLFEYAGLMGCQTRTAGTLRCDGMPEGCDLLIAAHSHDFIGRGVRNRLRLGALGYHPSLLPRHRGRDAIKWTLKMGDAAAGGSVFWLNDTVDGGPVAAQDWCFVRPDDTASTLWRRELFPMGLRLLEKVLSDVKAGRLVMKDQDHSLATWEPSMDGAPRLFRPELPQIGTLEGWTVEK